MGSGSINLSTKTPLAPYNRFMDNITSPFSSQNTPYFSGYHTSIFQDFFQLAHEKSTEVNVARMKKNLFKAITEKELKQKGYASLTQVLKSLSSPNQAPTQITDTSIFCLQNQRLYMEDFYLFTAIPRGILAGVFDGHGGCSTANYSRTYFPGYFQFFLEYFSDPFTAFEATLKQIHTDIKHTNDDPYLQNSGTVCAVSFIELKTALVYTATLGDCEANVYRKIDDDLVSISLSPSRNWSSKTDSWRLVNHEPNLSEIQKKNLRDSYMYALDPKYIRATTLYNNSTVKLNVSRALGDLMFEDVLIQKPKITIFKLQKGDVLTLSSDGMDFVPITKLTNTVANSARNTLSKSLAECSLQNYYSDEGNYHSNGDNVCVISIPVD